jgi:hypothetical protein
MGFGLNRKAVSKYTVSQNLVQYKFLPLRAKYQKPRPNVNPREIFGNLGMILSQKGLASDGEI